VAQRKGPARPLLCPRAWRAAELASSPPHCPNPDCDPPEDPEAWRFEKEDCYDRKQGPRRVQQYIRHHCHGNLGAQTCAARHRVRMIGESR
jgi:hypothetical protein